MGSSTSRCALSESSKHEPPRHPCDGRSDTLSNPDALQAIHVDGTDQPPEHSVVLDGHINRTKRRTIDTAKYIPVSVFPVAYAVHRFYRRYKPRRLPTITAFTLVELYLAAATPVLARCLGMADVMDTVRDRDRCTIMLAGRRLRQQVNLKESRIQESMRILDATIAQTPAGQSLQTKLKLIREGDYQSGNLTQRLIWRHRHAWSDRITWNGLALLLLNDYPKPDITQPPLRTVRLDWDLCVTYLATMSLANQIEEWRQRVRTLFAVSVPATLLARFSGRRLLYFPMSGAQRLLLGAFLYADWTLHAGLFQYVKRIRDKGTFAQLVTATFGNFDEEVKELARDVPLEIEEWFE